MNCYPYPPRGGPFGLPFPRPGPWSIPRPDDYPRPRPRPYPGSDVLF